MRLSISSLVRWQKLRYRGRDIEIQILLQRKVYTYVLLALGNCECCEIMIEKVERME